MHANLKQLDLEKLPEEARKEIIDFYEFLLSRYSYKKRKDRSKIDFYEFLLSRYSYKKRKDRSKLPEEFYNAIKKDRYLVLERKEIYNNG